jgi:hypothetical protein
MSKNHPSQPGPVEMQPFTTETVEKIRSKKIVATSWNHEANVPFLISPLSSTLVAIPFSQQICPCS